jgi:hypothetical protein
MSSIAIKVCGEISALIGNAALPTATRLEAQEAVEKVLQPILGGDRAQAYEDMAEQVDDLSDQIKEIADDVDDLLHAVKGMARQLEQFLKGKPS